MSTHRRVTLAWVNLSIAALLYSMAWAQQQTPKGPSIPMEYCATVNTADMIGPFNFNWQSDGRCMDNCTERANAFAIVQDKNCWCSNLIPHPNDQTSLKDCEAPCPGYPTDFCGGDGTYGYMEVGGFNPSGTAPAVARSSSTKKPSPTSSTAQPTVTVTLPAESSSVTSSSSSSSSSASTTSGDDSSDPPSVTTITADGTVRTVTATPDSNGSSDGATVENKDGGLGSGAIAGIVVGVIGGLAVLIGVIVWMWCVKRKRRNEEAGLGSPIRGGSGSPGTMATPNSGEISENRFAGGADAQKRRSHLMPIDPRLDPFAKGIYAGDQNRSRESFDSLQDNQDYSRRVHQPGRVLRAMNPDPEVN